MSATVLTNNVAEIPQILSFRRCFHAVCRADVYYAAKRTFSWKSREIQHCNQERLVFFPGSLQTLQDCKTKILPVGSNNEGIAPPGGQKRISGCQYFLGLQINSISICPIQEERLSLACFIQLFQVRLLNKAARHNSGRLGQVVTRLISDPL